jgi:hypothetical protein
MSDDNLSRDYAARMWAGFSGPSHCFEVFEEFRQKIRAQALEEARDRIIPLQADTSAIAPEHRLGFRSGHAAARYAARDLITEMLDDDPLSPRSCGGGV